MSDRFADRTAKDYYVVMMRFLGLLTLSAAFAWFSVEELHADQVVMQNGDTLNGKVLSVTTNTLVLQNDNLGNVTLPRPKIAAIHFGTIPASSLTATQATVQIPRPPASATNSASDFSAAVRGIRDQTNLVQQVQSQILGSAGPDAINKFNEMLDSLSTGNMDLNQLRQQAQTAADQLRSLKKDLGPDVGEEADSYLAILDGFIQETAPATAATNSPATPPKANSNAQSNTGQ
jgi:hypothetical protein